MSIVLIGIAVPTFNNYFSGLDNSKEPEYFTEAVFLATRQMQGIKNETMARLPNPAVFGTCAAFQSSQMVGANFNIECVTPPYDQYEFSWQVEDVGAGTPNTGGSGTFGKKITLTVSRKAGGMDPFQLVNLF